MPEGPECRKMALDLAKVWSGATLNEITVESGRYLKKPITGIEQFNKKLPLRIVGSGVHGKFIYAILSDETFLWFTLGMTGGFTQEKTPHSRVGFVMSDKTTWFTDQRNFGTVKIVHGKHKMIEKLQSLGPDMLAEDVSDEKFIECIRQKPDWEICKAIMDQSLVAGVGNYIKADSLWLARLAPARLVKDCTDDELSDLNRSIKTVMRESFSSGGATIRTYKNFDGTIGEYGSRFLVYNRKQDPDGNEIVKNTFSDNRTTHWCPNIQY